MVALMCLSGWDGIIFNHSWLCHSWLKIIPSRPLRHFRDTTRQGNPYHHSCYARNVPYSCKYCEKKFSQQQSVKLHERIHTGEKPYSCNNCNYRAISRGNITKHELIHAKEKERITKQQNCKIWRNHNDNKFQLCT